jgi:hypothetical protein
MIVPAMNDICVSEVCCSLCIFILGDYYATSVNSINVQALSKTGIEGHSEEAGLCPTPVLCLEL